MPDGWDELDGREDKESNEAWFQEIVKRLDELDRGVTRTIAWQKIRERLAAKLA